MFTLEEVEKIAMGVAEDAVRSRGILVLNKASNPTTKTSELYFTAGEASGIAQFKDLLLDALKREDKDG